MHYDPVVTGQFIYQIGESENLRKPSLPVTLEKLQSDEYKAKIAYLKKCMLRYRKLTKKGRAIAAVQVGIPEQIIVVYTPEKQDKTWILINPKVEKRSEKMLEYPEMCMSANSLIATVKRPAWIECSYYDEQGKKYYWNTKDITKRGQMYNRVLQHEIDHIHGIINIDLVPSKSLIFISDPKFYARTTFKEVRKSEGHV